MEKKSEILQGFILELLMGRRFGTDFFSGRLAFSNRTEGTKGMAFAGVHGWGLVLPSSSRESRSYTGWAEEAIGDLLHKMTP